MKRAFHLELAVVALVLMLSLGLRLAGLDVFLVHDEMRWACRSVGFRAGILRGDWAETYRVGHPGVVTMWLGALSIAPRDARAQAACEAFDDYRHFDDDDLPATTKEELSEVGAMVFQGRVGVALFTWLSIIALYFLTRTLLGPRIAVLSLALIALDPFYLALSRFLHTDAVHASLMTLSVLSLLVWARRATLDRPRLALLLASGAASGLAMVQKSPAVFLVPCAVLLLTASLLRQGVSRASTVGMLRALALWGVAAAVIYVAAWPAMWGDPLGTIEKVLNTATRYAAEGHTPGNYFLGQAVHDPGWLFYPVVALFRLSPLTLVGLVGVLARFTTKGFPGVRSFALAALLSYSVLFGGFMSLGDKMFDRYLLPAIPALMITAAVGLLWLATSFQQWVHSQWSLGRYLSPRRMSMGVVVLALVVQAVVLLAHHPYYLTYYNPLLGGATQARRALLVGWGEGYDQAAAYLNAKPGAEELQVTTPTTAAFAPLFDGETWPMDRYYPWRSDYVLFYVSGVQRGQDEALLQEYAVKEYALKEYVLKEGVLNPSRKPEHVVSLHGVDYVWIYRNDRHEGPIAFIEQHSQAEEGECILVNGDSLFAKHYNGDLPVYTFSPQYQAQGRSYAYWDGERMSGFVDAMSADCSRVWHPRDLDGEGNRYVDLLDVRGVLIEEESFPHMEVSLHHLVEREVAWREVDLRFGDLRLRSYGVTDPPPAWGRDGGVLLAWEALGPVEEDYSVFLHLYDAHGHRIAQGDSLMVDHALRPTSDWEPHIAKRALYHLEVPPATPAGQYTLELGVYQLESGDRLPILNADSGHRRTSARFPLSVGVPDQMPTTADLTIERVLKRSLVPNLELVGYDLEQRAVLAGESAGVRLYWQAHGAIDHGLRLQLEVQGEDGTSHAQEAFDLTSTDYPPTRWRPDELLGAWYYPSTPENMLTGEVILKLDLLDEGGRSVLPRPVELLALWVQSAAPRFDAPLRIDQPIKVSLGEQITLWAYELDCTAQAGEAASVTLYWKAEQKVDTAYKVFVHLYDGQGGILAQSDGQPGLGTRPTTTWERGEFVADRHFITIPPDAELGSYELGVGLYDPQSGKRVPVFDPEGELVPQDRIILGSVAIES